MLQVSSSVIKPVMVVDVLKDISIKDVSRIAHSSLPVTVCEPLAAGITYRIRVPDKDS